MSGDRSSPRYDLVATTRRSWSRAQKCTIVAEIGVGDATLSSVARRHAINTSLLFRWRHELEAVNNTEQHRAPPSQPALSFVPVNLRLSTVPVTSPPTTSPPSDPPSIALMPPSKLGTIDVVLSGGRTVRVGADVDTTVLLRIVEALERAS